MLTTNIMVELQISNGSFGTVTKIASDSRIDEEHAGVAQRIRVVPKYIIVKFEDTTCPRLPGLEQGEIPIFPVSASFRYGFPGMTRPATIRRWQLPIIERLLYFPQVSVKNS